jgi:hypothetical protein
MASHVANEQGMIGSGDISSPHLLLSTTFNACMPGWAGRLAEIQT